MAERDGRSRSEAGLRRRVQIGRAHVNSSHQIISYAVFCLKKKNGECEGSVYRMLATLSRSESTKAGGANGCAGRPRSLRLYQTDGTPTRVRLHAMAASCCP